MPPADFDYLAYSIRGYSPDVQELLRLGVDSALSQSEKDFAIERALYLMEHES